MAARAVSAPLRALPNALTIGRLVLVPIFIVLLATAPGGKSWPAAIVFAVAGATDQLDGWLARRWHVESEFGKIADPLADRLMIDSAVLLLVLHGRLWWPALVIVAARDLFLLGGYRLVLPRGYELSVNFLGKLATWLLYLALGLLMVTSSSTEWPLWLFWSGIILALAAAGQYVASVRKAVRA